MNANKPVAWINKTELEDGFYYPKILTKRETISNNTPLYTHPVKEQDEDFDAICLENKRLQAEIEALKDFAREIIIKGDLYLVNVLPDGGMEVRLKKAMI